MYKSYKSHRPYKTYSQSLPQAAKDTKNHANKKNLSLSIGSDGGILYFFYRGVEKIAKKITIIGQYFTNISTLVL